MLEICDERLSLHLYIYTTGGFVNWLIFRLLIDHFVVKEWKPMEANNPSLYCVSATVGSVGQQWGGRRPRAAGCWTHCPSRCASFPKPPNSFLLRHVCVHFTLALVLLFWAQGNSSVVFLTFPSQYSPFVLPTRLVPVWLLLYRHLSIVMWHIDAPDDGLLPRQWVTSRQCITNTCIIPSRHLAILLGRESWIKHEPLLLYTFGIHFILYRIVCSLLVVKMRR